jgi:hypothetical protein
MDFFKLLVGGGELLVNFSQLLAPFAFLCTVEATLLFILAAEPSQSDGKISQSFTPTRYKRGERLTTT